MDDEERNIPLRVGQASAEVRDRVLSDSEDDSLTAKESESDEQEGERVRSQHPHYVDSRETTPEACQRPRRCPRNLIEVQQTVVGRQLRQSDSARQEEGLVRSRRLSRSTEEKSRVEIPTHFACKGEEREIGGVGGHAGAVSRVYEGDRAVVVDAESPRHASHAISQTPLDGRGRMIPARSSETRTSRRAIVCADLNRVISPVPADDPRRVGSWVR